MIGAGCFEDDACRLFRRNPGDQPGMAGAIVGELLKAAFGVDVDIEMILRDVDADGDLICRWCY
jgi:hypothetical protein